MLLVASSTKNNVMTWCDTMSSGLVCTTVLSLFYHRSGTPIIFVALVAKPRVATLNEKPHMLPAPRK